MDTAVLSDSWRGFMSHLHIKEAVIASSRYNNYQPITLTSFVQVDKILESINRDYLLDPLL